MSPLISIIVPVYNVVDYLTDSINSILNQTYSNIEVILVDDGSKDGCSMICDKYASIDNRIRVVHKKNGGLSDARNAGINIATGTYIGFVDSDDWIDKEMYETMLYEIERTGSDICVCGYYREYVNNVYTNCPSEHASYNTYDSLSVLFQGEEFQDHAWSKLYKAELFESVRYPVGMVYEDIRTTYKLFQKSKKVCTIPTPLYHYRQRKSSIARSVFNDKKIQMIDATREIFQNDFALQVKFKNELKHKELMIECLLLRDMLLDNDTMDLEEYCELFEEYLYDIKQNWKQLLFDLKITKANKLIACLSLFGKKVLVYCFSLTFVKKRLTEKYIYFQ